MLDAGIDADIWPPGPRRLGRSWGWIRAGFGYPSLGATSRVMRKWASWSMPHGIRTGTSFPASMVGRNAGAAWKLVQKISPMLFAFSNPKTARVVEYVTRFATSTAIADRW